MNPQPGQYVIIYFRNGIQLDGIVVDWSDQKSSIMSASGTSKIVIHKTLDDILFYKITDVKSEYNKLKEKPLKQEDDIKSLAELKIELNQLERTEINNKLKDHKADGMREVSYGLPFSNIKIQGSIERPGKKTSRPDNEFGAELQDLFTKES